MDCESCIYEYVCDLEGSNKCEDYVSDEEDEGGDRIDGP